MEQYYFISFDNTSHALQAERFLKDNKCDITVMPTPTDITHSCGLSIKFNLSSLSEIEKTIERGGLKIAGIYRLQRDKGVRKVEKV